MPAATPTPLVLAGLAALSVGIGAIACDPNGGGASLTQPGVITDSPIGARGALLELTPVTDTIRLGGSARFTATFVDPLLPPPDPARLRWSVDDTSLALVNDTGAVRVRRPGVATIRVAVDTEPPGTASLVILDTIGLSTSGLPTSMRVAAHGR